MSHKLYVEFISKKQMNNELKKKFWLNEIVKVV